MAKAVNVPGHGLVNFPDAMTDDQIAHAIENDIMKPQAAPVAQIPVSVPQKTNGRETIDEIGRVADKAVRGGLLSLPGFIGDAAVGIPNWAARKTGFIADVPANTPGSPEGYMKMPSQALEEMTGGELHQPKTELGKVVGNVGQSAIGSIGPGGVVAIPRNLAIGAAAGAGGELTARTLQDDNVGTRLVGGLIGGGAASLIARHVPNVQNIIRDAMKGVQPADIARALTLRDVVNRAGIPSAATQFFGGKTTLPEVFARAASNPAVRPTVDVALEGTNTKAAEALRNWQSQHLPQTGAAGQALLTDIQEAADAHMGGLWDKAKQGYVDALPPDASRIPYPPQRVDSIVNTLRSIAGSPDKFGAGTTGGDFLSGIAQRISDLGKKTKTVWDAHGVPSQVRDDVQAGHVNNILKDLNTRAEAEGYKNLPLTDAKNALRAATPEFQPSRDAMSKVIEDEVNPAKRGLVGQIAEMGGGVRDDKFTAKESIISLVLNDHNKQPAQIAELGTQIGNSRIGAILDTYINRKTAETIKGSKNRASELQQPFDLQAKIRGTSDSALRANVDAALRASAKYQKVPAADLQKGFHSLLDGLETYRDLKVPAGIDKSSIDAAASRNAAAYALRPGFTGAHKIEDYLLRKVHKRIVEMALSPDGVEQLVAIGKSPKPEVLHTFIQSLIADAEATPDHPEAKR